MEEPCILHVCIKCPDFNYGNDSKRSEYKMNLQACKQCPDYQRTEIVNAPLLKTSHACRRVGFSNHIAVGYVDNTYDLYGFKIPDDCPFEFEHLIYQVKKPLKGSYKPDFLL